MGKQESQETHPQGPPPFLKFPIIWMPISASYNVYTQDGIRSLLQVDKGTIWIAMKVASAFLLCVFLFFFFFLFSPQQLILSTINSAYVHYSWVPQITLFSNFFIKNRSHNTIYTFKNYFATVFSVLVKISSIQTYPSCVQIIRQVTGMTFILLLH